MMKNEPITRGADTPAKKKAVFRPLKRTDHQYPLCNSFSIGLRSLTSWQHPG